MMYGLSALARGEPTSMQLWLNAATEVPSRPRARVPL